MLGELPFAHLDEIAPGVKNVAPTGPDPEAEVHLLRSRWLRHSQASRYRHLSDPSRLRERMALVIGGRTWPLPRTTAQYVAGHTGATVAEVHEVLTDLEREGLVVLRAGGVVDICTPGLIDRIAGVQR